jgi:glycosyltransferase involved in cell wall biosynthesis
MLFNKKLNIGVVFDQIIYAGGGFNQSINAILLLKELPSNSINVRVITFFEQNVNYFESIGFKTTFFKLGIFDRIVRFLRNSYFSNNLIFNKIFGKSKFESILMKKEIDLIYFTSPSDFYKDLSEINYIYTVWDLCHRDYPEFPEVRRNRTIELRENIYTKALIKAVAIIVDSQLGKQNILRRYNIDDDRICIIPFSPSTSINNSINFDVKKNLLIETDYVFYPAQFWAHKNHIYILQALKILELQHGMNIYAIFSGVDKGNLNHIKKVAKELDLEQRIKYVGYIDDNKMVSYYKQSIALVMPTYFGPTNLPPLEAFALGVPVLYSDLVGLRDQVEDAALLMNLNNPDSLANHIHCLLTEKKIKNDR